MYQLSYSSSQKLNSCERKLFYYKKDYEVDPTIDQDTTALVLGKSFHYVLEKSMHKKPEDIMRLLRECVTTEKLPEESMGLVHAMVLAYLRVRKKTNLECVAVEHKLENENFLGYVDAIMVDPSGGWWISDLKTAAGLNQILPARLSRDTQLNLYAYFKRYIALDLDLDVKKFMGCIYSVTTKSKAKQRGDEEYVDYVKRLLKLVKSYEYRIPESLLSPKDFYRDHMFRQSIAEQILRGEREARPNFGECDKWFRPCEYWHHCHGGTFAEKIVELERIESE